MHIEYFYYYRDFAKTLSITKTAANYYMTPQGISKAIHSLERELNVSLINRNGNTVSLSCAGHELATDTEAIIDAYEHAQRRLAAYTIRNADSPNKQVKIKITAFVATFILPFLDLQHQTRFSATVTIQESNIFKIIPRIATDSKAETLGIISIPRVPEFEDLLENYLHESNLVYCPLLHVPLCVLMSDSSAFSGYDHLKMSDIQGYPVVFYKDPVLYSAVTGIIGEQNVVMTTNNHDVLVKQLEQNYAITFSPKILEIHGLPKSTVLKPIEGSFSTEVGFIGSANMYSNSDIIEITSYIREFFTENSTRNPYKDTYQMVDSMPEGN